MDHYADIKREYEEDLVGAFPVPITLILVALKYAMRKSWGGGEGDKIKAAVLKVWDEVVVPADLPIIDGAIEAAVENFARTVLVELLDAALGPKQ